MISDWWKTQIAAKERKESKKEDPGVGREESVSLPVANYIIRVSLDIENAVNTIRVG